MEIKNWFEPDLSWLSTNYDNASFNKELGMFSFSVNESLKASVKPYANWATFNEDSEIRDTVWIILLSDPNGQTAKFTLDMSKYSLPFWWAHYQRPAQGHFYKTEDCHEVADFIVGIWNGLYVKNKESYGFICAAWLAGFNFT